VSRSRAPTRIHIPLSRNNVKEYPVDDLRSPTQQDIRRPWIAIHGLMPQRHKVEVGRVTYALLSWRRLSNISAAT
jgi:hypothetical protein